MKKTMLTWLPNHILDALCLTNISCYERRILDIILKETYQFKGIKLSWRPDQWKEFSDRTGSPKTAIKRTILKLVEKNMINVVWDRKEITFLDNPEKWIGKRG